MKQAVQKMIVGLIAFMMAIPLLADNTDTFTFTNNTGKEVNDLHIEWSKAVKITRVTEFKKTSGSNTSKADFSNGTVANGNSVEVTVNWDGTDPKVKIWYWTIDGKKVRNEKASDVNASVMNDRDGMTVVSVATSSGNIQAFLPEYLVAGQKISGTVIAQPTGINPEMFSESSSRLQGMVLEVNGKPVKPNNKFDWVIPATAGLATLVLKDGSGNVLSSQIVPVLPEAPVIPTIPGGAPFDIPPICESGKPISIVGNFNLETPTNVTIGGMNVPVLVESPQGITTWCPPSVVGSTEITIKDGDNEYTQQINALKLEMNASKTQLMSGETTQVMIVLSGCKDLPKEAFPIEMTVTNNTPENSEIIQFGAHKGGVVASLLSSSSSNTSTIQITPDMVDATGNVSLTATLQGKEPGAFEILCNVAKGKCGAKTHMYIIGRLSKGEDSKGFFVEWREDCYEGTCYKPKGHEGDHKYAWKRCKTHKDIPHKEYFETKEKRDARYEEVEKDQKLRQAKMEADS